MRFRAWRGFCLCAEEDLFPRGAVPCPRPFHPLVFLVRRDPLTSRGFFAISKPEELFEAEGPACLRPCEAVLPEGMPEGLAALVREQGAGVLNAAFPRCFDYLLAQNRERKTGFTVTLVGLGDVGGTVLTGLVLLGREITRIALYDPNRALAARYEMEMNQLLSPDGRPLPRVTLCREEDLFDCDLLVFTASKGVPGLDSGAQDVRLAQWEANRALIAPYARRARQAGFSGIFCQVSDPVDQLARAVFLESNRDEDGQLDFGGLLPEQVQGFGLGVMAARARYYAEKEGIPFENGRVYGPHGAGLVAANHWGRDYDPERSTRLTGLTRDANLRVRDLGYKPYIAPGLSSAAISLVRMLRGEAYYGSVPLGGVYFGCRSRRTPQGTAILREDVCPALMARLEHSYRDLQKENPL